MALVSGLALVACSSDDPTNPGGGGTGSFSATVTGGVTASFSGVAVQAEVDNILNLGWLALMGDDLSTAAPNSISFGLNGSRPGPGTYQLIDLNAAPDILPGEGLALLLLGDGTTPSYFGVSVSGTVTITSSSVELVEGSYNFQVSDGGQPPVVATVTGTFSAVSGTVNLSPERPSGARGSWFTAWARPGT
jgi:hypothetical protein